MARPPRSVPLPRPRPAAPRRSPAFGLQRLIRTDADIHTAVRAWCGEWERDGDANKLKCTRRGDPAGAEAAYGPMARWDVSRVTSMRALFVRMAEFDEDISGWDVRSVEDMFCMFSYASRFNRDLSQWDVRGVREMRIMFCRAESFDQDLSRWEVRGDCVMTDMFFGSPLHHKAPEWWRR